MSLHDYFEARSWARYEASPECKCCGQKIQDEHYYDIDGVFYCERCLDNEYRKDTEDYIDDHL